MSQPSKSAIRQMEIDKEIQKIKAENNYKFIKIEPSDPSVKSLEEIGCLCSDEIGQNSEEIVPHSKWQSYDTISSCIVNAANLYSQYKFNELKDIVNDSIQIQYGMKKKIINFDDYLHVNSFLKTNWQQTNVRSFENNYHSDKFIEIFGYFKPEATDKYKFDITDTDEYYFWFNDSALYHYSHKNAIIYKGKSKSSVPNQKFLLKKGEYYPFRLHFGSKSGINTKLVNITGDNQGEIDQEKELLLLIKSGEIYKKYTMFFAFTEAKNANKKFHIHFIDNINDCKNLEKIKVNPEYIFDESVIEVPITYTSGTMKVQGNGQTIRPPFNPDGAKVMVDESIYKSKNPLYNTIPYTERVTCNTIKPHCSDNDVYRIRPSGGKIRVKIYRGYWGGNERHMNDNNLIGVTYWNNIYNNIPQNTSYLIEANVSSGHGYNTQFKMHSDDQARLYVNGSRALDTTCCTELHSKEFPYTQVKNIKIFCGNGGGPGYIRLVERSRYRQRYKSWGRTRYRWRWSGYSQINGKFSIGNSSFGGIKRSPVVIKNIPRTRQELVQPSSTSVKEIVDKEMVEDTKNRFKSTDYAQLPNPAPTYQRGNNFSKTLGVDLRIKIDNPANVTDRHLYMRNGELVYAYSYNNEVSESHIEQLRYADTDKSDGNYLKLENDGSLSIYTKNNVKKISYSFLPSDIEPNNIIVNPEWQILSRTFLDAGERLSSKHIPYIISPNKKYKLTFNGDKLVVRYCLEPFYKEENLKMTKENHIDFYTKKQIFCYYTLPNDLRDGSYKIYSHPLIDKILFSRNNTSENIKSLKFLPIYSNNPYGDVLSVYNFDTDLRVTPLDKSNVSINNNISNNSQCVDLCRNNDKCNYSFYDEDNKQCLVDNNNSTPSFTRVLNSSLPKTYMNKKNYMIRSKCNEFSDKGIETTKLNQYSDYNVIYDSLKPNYESHLINDNKKVGVCGHPKIIDLGNQHNITYKDGVDDKVQDGFRSIREGNQIMSGDQYELQDRANNLEKSLKLFDDQQKVASSLAKNHETLYQNYITNYNTYLRDSSSGGLNEKNIKNDIRKDLPPEIFRMDNDPLDLKTNKLQVMKEDNKKLLVHENTMYSIATISAATLIITAIILARE